MVTDLMMDRNGDGHAICVPAPGESGKGEEDRILQLFRVFVF